MRQETYNNVVSKIRDAYTSPDIRNIDIEIYKKDGKLWCRYSAAKFIDMFVDGAEGCIQTYSQNEKNGAVRARQTFLDIEEIDYIELNYTYDNE